MQKPWREPGWNCALVQILVVVANIQMRTLKTKWRKVPCEQQLDMGYSILRMGEFRWNTVLPTVPPIERE